MISPTTQKRVKKQKKNTHNSVNEPITHSQRAQYNQVPVHRYCNKMAHQFAKQKNEKPYSNRQELTKYEIKLQKKKQKQKTITKQPKLKITIKT